MNLKKTWKISFKKLYHLMLNEGIWFFTESSCLRCPLTSLSFKLHSRKPFGEVPNWTVLQEQSHHRYSMRGTHQRARSPQSIFRTRRTLQIYLPWPRRRGERGDHFLPGLLNTHVDNFKIKAPGKLRKRKSMIRLNQYTYDIALTHECGLRGYQVHWVLWGESGGSQFPLALQIVP